MSRATTKFMTSAQIEKRCVKLYGVEYQEALEMSYDNLREYSIELERQVHRLDKALMKMEAAERRAARTEEPL